MRIMLASDPQCLDDAMQTAEGGFAEKATSTGFRYFNSLFGPGGIGAELATADLGASVPRALIDDACRKWTRRTSA